jgi:hypothetical protein
MIKTDINKHRKNSVSSNVKEENLKVKKKKKI